MQSNDRQNNPPCPVPHDAREPLDETEQWLPESMQALAGQLSFEADQLASVYALDPPAVEVVKADVAQPARRWAPWWLSAAAILAVATLATIGYQMNRMVSKTVDRSTPSPRAALRSDRIGDVVEPERLASGQLEQRAERIEIDLSPAVFVNQFSGPEFEAWLDLQQDTTSQRERVSL